MFIFNFSENDITFYRMATYRANFHIPEPTKEQIDGLKQLFDKFDTDHNGKLDRDEISNVMKAQNLPTENVEMIMKVGDTDHDGGISFDEFINIIKLMAQMKAAQQELCKRLFAQIDIDENGYLDESEVSTFLNLLTGGKATPEQVKETMAKYDTNKDGKISLQELLNAGGMN